MSIRIRLPLDADPDPCLDLTPSIKNEFIFVSAGLNCFIFFVSVIVVIIFNIFVRIMKFSAKK
jgi:hypothetical protein